jgi:hypothetical protein
VAVGNGDQPMIDLLWAFVLPIGLIVGAAASCPPEWFGPE